MMVLAILFRTQDFMGWLSRLTTIPKLSALRCNQCLLIPPPDRRVYEMPLHHQMYCGAFLELMFWVQPRSLQSQCILQPMTVPIASIYGC